MSTPTAKRKVAQDAAKVPVFDFRTAAGVKPADLTTIRRR